MPTAMLHGVGSVRIWTRGRFDSAHCSEKPKYTIMEAFTLIRMKEALDRIRKTRSATRYALLGKGTPSCTTLQRNSSES